MKKILKTERIHLLFPQLIENEQVLRQKLKYIHQNPVKLGYVDESVHWRYSSARDYAGLAGLVTVYKDWL
jgi:putative transposase